VVAPDVSDRSLIDLFSLTGRRAVVTGAARGIGAAVVNRLAECGADVLVADRDLAGARHTADAVAERWGTRVVAHELDVSDTASIAAAMDAAVTQLGGIDILVNNAGIFPPTPLTEIDQSVLEDVLTVNLRGTLFASRAAAARMIAAGRGGVIVSISSTAGFRAGGSGIAAYVASKHGVRGLSKALAVELGPHGIRALDVAPTLTSTPGILGRIGNSSASAAWATLGERLPMRRIAVADDVARVVAFAVSDLAVMITGSTILVDGGHIAG